MASWDSIPEDEKPFQRRLMEVFAGFAEHADYNAGRVIDEIERHGNGDNTLIFYIWGDNGSSSEGQNGTISEQLAQNGIPTTISQHIKALDELGGLDALGGPKTDNMYHAGWAWAGSTPYKGTKLLAVALRRHAQPDGRPVAGEDQARRHAAPAVPPLQRHRPDDLRDSRHHAAARGERHRAGSDRRREHRLQLRRPEGRGPTADPVLRDHGQPRHLPRWLDGLARSARVTRGWAGLPPGIREWSPDKDKWELYNLEEDWSQANDLAAKNAGKARADEGDLPHRGGEEQRPAHRRRPVGRRCFIPSCASAPPYTEWTFSGDTVRMPEFCAPALGNKPNVVTMDAEVPANANGVLYTLGGFSGGLTCFVKDGILCYEYNLFEIQRTKIRAKEKLPTGKVKIEVETNLCRAQARRADERDHEGEWQGRGRRPGAGQRAAALHRQRLLRHRHRSRFAGVARLLTTRRRSSSTAPSSGCTWSTWK